MVSHVNDNTGSSEQKAYVFERPIPSGVIEGSSSHNIDFVHVNTGIREQEAHALGVTFPGC